MKFASQAKGEIMPVRHQAPAKAKARADARLIDIRAKRVKDVVENPDEIAKNKKPQI